MKAEEIEQLYQETMFGYDEPTLAYVSGKTLKKMTGCLVSRSPTTRTAT